MPGHDRYGAAPCRGMTLRKVGSRRCCLNSVRFPVMATDFAAASAVMIWQRPRLEKKRDCPDRLDSVAAC